MDSYLRQQSRNKQCNNSNMWSELAYRARIEGPSVYTEIIRDRLIWNNAPEVLQDVCISQIATLLPGFSFVKTELYSCNGISHRIASFQHDRTGAIMNLLPGGNYQMGGKGYNDEQPVHECRIEGPFLLGRFPLLQAEWDRPGLGLEDKRNWKDPALPMEGVSWDDAQAWLEQVGDGLRLPSEAEWEYACRAGTTTEYFWGDGMDPSYCWFEDNSEKRTHAPEEHADKANAFGLVDMSGNVWEWCRDGWIHGYQSGPNNQQSRGDGESVFRVRRGGCWGPSAGGCRSAFRAGSRPGSRLNYLGLRLSRSIDI